MIFTFDIELWFKVTDNEPDWGTVGGENLKSGFFNEI